MVLTMLFEWFKSGMKDLRDIMKTYYDLQYTKAVSNVIQYRAKLNNLIFMERCVQSKKNPNLDFLTAKLKFVNNQFN
jgi:hypothetical protein